MTLFFDSKDIHNFKNWININWEKVIWDEKYTKRLDDFWKLFFTDGLSLRELMDSYYFAENLLKKGPLHSWINWLRNKNLIYLFITKNINLYDLSILSSISMKDLAIILRSYFIAHYPNKRNYFNEIFNGPKDRMKSELTKKETLGNGKSRVKVAL